MFGESTAEAFRLRYGFEPGSVVDLGGFLNHRSVRHFAEKDVPRETVETLVAASQSAATSSNLQLYSLVSVRDPDLRAQINAVSVISGRWLRHLGFLRSLSTSTEFVKPPRWLANPVRGLIWWNS